MCLLSALRKVRQNAANRAITGRKTNMIKVLFICHGNICRSPMAEFVMKDLVKKAHLEDQFEIASAATSTEEIWGGRGNPVYPPARAKLKEHGIDPGGKRARRTTREDYKSIAAGPDRKWRIPGIRMILTRHGMMSFRAAQRCLSIYSESASEDRPGGNDCPKAAKYGSWNKKAGAVALSEGST